MSTRPRTPRPSPTGDAAGGTAPTSRCPSPPFAPAAWPPQEAGARQSRSAGSIGPLSSEEDFCRSGWEVFLHLGVVVGHDAGDVGVGFCPLVLCVAGSDEVEQGNVLVASGLQGYLGSSLGKLRLPGAEVVSGDGVREVDDHRGVLEVQPGVL